VYQEDVTKVAVELAGFSIEDGEQLRKVLSKKHKQRRPSLGVVESDLHVLHIFQQIH